MAHEGKILGNVEGQIENEPLICSTYSIDTGIRSEKVYYSDRRYSGEGNNSYIGDGLC